MTETKFSVSWDSYQKSICNGLSFLQQREEFVDMTIAADGHLVKVHRMVMSLVSPYLKELITSAQCPHPVIFLNRVSYQALQLILEYAYTGEVLVDRDYIDEFLQVCKTLHVKGLENMGKYAIENAIEVSNKVKDQPPDNIGAPTIPKLDDSTADLTDYDDHFGTEMDQDNKKNDILFTEDRSQLYKENKKSLDTFSKSTVQYTISNRGTLQLILNRYIYCQRYTCKDNSRSWRCVETKTCPASVTTRGDRVIQRLGAHNHSFHDAQILKRVRNNNVFAVEPKKQEIAAIIDLRK